MKFEKNAIFTNAHEKCETNFDIPKASGGSQNVDIKENSVQKWDDRKLVKNILAGDRNIAGYYISKPCFKYFNYIKKQYLYNINIEAGDLINDFYIFLQESDWEKLRGFRFESKLETWVCTLATRHLLKKYHKELKENSRTNPQINENYLTLLKPSQKKMSRFELMNAINQLENQRERVLMQYTLEGFGTEEIAKKLEISNNNVYILRSRAIKNLRILIVTNKNNI